MSLTTDQNIEIGLRWSALRQIVTALASVLGALAYTRFLRPEDLGAFGLAFIVFSGLVLLIEAPFRDAVVYFQSRESDYSSAAFWLLVAFGFPAAALVIALAGPLGAYYGSTLAAGLTRVLVAAFLFEVLAVVPGALLLKHFRFATHEILKLITTLIQLLGWIGLVLAGFGPWSLVIPILVASAFWAVSTWVAARFVPAWRPGRHAFVAIMRYSRSLLGSKLLTYLKLNIDNATVGRLGERSLGLYSFGEDQSAAAVISVGGAVAQVTLPAMAAAQDRPGEQRRVFLEMLRLTATLSTPMQIGMIVLAGLGVRVIFGQQWLAGVAVLQAYLTFRLVDTLSKICDSALSSIGRPDIRFKVDLVQLPFFVLSTLFRMQVWGGFLGVAWSLSITRLIFGLIYLVVALRVAEVPGRLAAGYLGPSTAAGAAMGLVVFILQNQDFGGRLAPALPTDFLNSLAQLVILVLAGATFYGVMLFTIDRHGFLEVVRLAWRVVRP